MTHQTQRQYNRSFAGSVLFSKPVRPTRKEAQEAIFYFFVASTSLNGAALTTRVTAPLFRHCAQMNTVLCVPFSVEIRTLRRFGLKTRRVMPVTFVPTPPRYLARPRVWTTLPTCFPLPQKLQTAIALPP